MITTLFLLLLFGFQLWHMTAQKSDKIVQPSYLQAILRNKQLARLIGGGLIGLALILFIVKLGFASGIFAAIVGLMGIGSLVVLLGPFQYINEKAVLMLFVVFVFLEIFI